MSHPSVKCFKTELNQKTGQMFNANAIINAITTGKFMPMPRGYKTFFMLNSVEHEILKAHKYKNIKKFGFFKAQISRECYFSRS